MKTCTKCGEIKSLTEFHAKKAARDGKASSCKECKSKIDRNYYLANDEDIKTRARDSHAANREHANAERNRRYWENREDHLRKCRIWREENRERDRENSRKWYRNNKGHHSEYQKGWYRRNKERCRENQRKWLERNKDRAREYKNAYYRKRYADKKQEPEFKLSVVMRVTLRKQLEKIGSGKQGRTSRVLGYSPEDLKQHLERQFSKGMSWDNYGEWHIDHIVPVSEHLKSGETDPAIINCLTNLRPMWAGENQSKNSKRTHLI